MHKRCKALPRCIELPQCQTPVQSPVALPEPRRIDLQELQFSSSREIQKSGNYDPKFYSTHFEELLKRTLEGFSYGRNYIKDNVKGDRGFEDYCVKQLDSIIIARSKSLSTNTKDTLNELRVSAVLFRTREEIRPFDLTKDKPMSDIQQKLFKDLLPKITVLSNTKSLQEIDFHLRFFVYASFVATGKTQLDQLQATRELFVKKIDTLPLPEIQKYLKDVLDTDTRKNVYKEQLEVNELFAGIAVMELSTIPPFGIYIYQAKALFVPSKEDPHKSDFIAKDGQRWRLGITTFDGDGVIYLKNLKTGAFASLEAEKLAAMIPPTNGKKTNIKENEKVARANMDKFLAEVSADHLIEQNKEIRAKLIRKDLKKDETAFFAVYPKQNDMVIMSSLLTSMIKETAFAKRYNLKPGEGNYIFSDDPLQPMEQEIDRLMASNPKIKVFYIDINHHGSPEEFKFKNPLKVEALVKLFNQQKYREKGIEFNIETLACFGAGVSKGLVDAYKKDPGLQINAFMHTKNYVPNFGLSSTTINPLLTNNTTMAYSLNLPIENKQPTFMFKDHLRELHPPHTELLFLMNLLDPEIKTLGEAYHKADLEVRNHLYINPEAVVDGIKQTGGTKEEKPKFEK